MTLKQKTKQAKDKISKRVNELKTLIASAGHGDSIEVIQVPVAYSVGVKKKAGSTLTDEQYAALLQSLQITNQKID